MSAESEAEILKEIRALRSETKDINRMFGSLREIEERREQRWLTAVQEYKAIHDRIDGVERRAAGRLKAVEARVDKLEGQGRGK